MDSPSARIGVSVLVLCFPPGLCSKCRPTMPACCENSRGLRIQADASIAKSSFTSQTLLGWIVYNSTVTFVPPLEFPSPLTLPHQSIPCYLAHTSSLALQLLSRYLDIHAHLHSFTQQPTINLIMFNNVKIFTAILLAFTLSVSALPVDNNMHVRTVLISGDEHDGHHDHFVKVEGDDVTIVSLVHCITSTPTSVLMSSF
jgi:hypothetical protein